MAFLEAVSRRAVEPGRLIFNVDGKDLKTMPWEVSKMVRKTMRAQLDRGEL